MTILVRCFGNQEYGLGHVFRSMTLCRALKRHGYSSSCVLFEDEMDEIPAICAANGVPVVPLSIDPPTRFDFLIYDMPYVEREVLTTMKAANPYGTIIALDFDDYVNENVARVFNLFNHGDFSLAESNHCTKFEHGFHLAIIREEFFPYRLNGVTINENIAKILVTFGGADPAGNTLAALRSLQGLPGKKISVIRGPLFHHEAQLAEMAGTAGLDVEVSCPVKNIEQWMAQADLVICCGGTTMLESLFLGRPTIIMPQTDAERIFASEAVAKEACLLAEPAADGDLTEKISSLEPKINRRRLSRNAMALVDGQGVDVILGDIIQPRPEAGRGLRHSP